MGIEGVSGGAMRAMQSVQVAKAGPNLEQLQSAGLRQDQDIRQLMGMLQNAAAMSGDPEKIKQLMGQLQQLAQLAPPAESTAAVGAAKAGGTTGAAAQELAKRLDDLKKQIETISQAGAAEQSGMGQQNLVQQQLNAMQVLGQDQNTAKGRDFMSMY